MRFLLVAALQYMLASAGWASPTPNPEAEQELSYDPAIVVDVAGAVTDVREAFRGNPLVGLHLLVQTRTGVLEIYLGPTDYVKEFELVLSKGSFVQIIGSAVSFSGGRVVLAREVRMGKTTLYLRDRAGGPNWPCSEAPVERASRPR